MLIYGHRRAALFALVAGITLHLIAASGEAQDDPENVEELRARFYACLIERMRADPPEHRSYRRTQQLAALCAEEFRPPGWQGPYWPSWLELGPTPLTGDAGAAGWLEHPGRAALGETVAVIAVAATACAFVAVDSVCEAQRYAALAEETG